MNAVARDASSICLLRDTNLVPEVLMVKRTPDARFMGGAWVFPGGAVDEEDRTPLPGVVGSTTGESDPWRVAAIRELAEETSIWILERGVTASSVHLSGEWDRDRSALAAIHGAGERLAVDALWYFANWVTPAPLPVRFDTRFFAAIATADVDAHVDERELVDSMWIRPDQALQRAGAGTLLVTFPTQRILEFLGRFTSTSALLEHLRAAPAVERLQPRLAVVGDEIRILMPDDPGFAEAGVAEGDPDVLATMMRIVDSGGEAPPEFRSA